VSDESVYRVQDRPAGLKPSSFCGVCGTAEQPAEKSQFLPNLPSAAKAAPDFIALLGTVETVPFQKNGYFSKL
jgi:hypothetical protein